MIWTTFKLAVRQLSRNLVRTGLTSLGVLIGVAAVIAMVSIGEGARKAINDDLAAIGQNLLYVVPGSGQGPGRGVGKPFAERDLVAIAEEVEGVRAVAPSDSVSGVAVFEENTFTTTLTGSTNAYLDAMAWSLSEGRRFEEGELLAGSDVCVLGQTVVEELFGEASPLDAVVRVDDLTCSVVGVLQAKGQNSFGQDQDNLLLIPARTFQRRLRGHRDVALMIVSAYDGVDSARVQADIESLMRQRRHIREGAEDDFTVRDMAEVLSMLDGVASVLTGFLAAVAAVSLLVGGIGIMNIMLVSVTERTREIGIRLSIGALARDVLLQFLMESMVLSTLGGVLGVGLGLVVAWGASVALEIPLLVSPLTVLAAFTFSGLIGVVFGFFPARRAARMRPIDALRHE